jgi:predicted acyl esterase
LNQIRLRRSIPILMRRLITILLVAAAAFSCASLTVAAEAKLDFGSVTEKHVMIPMRDGKRLFAYLYTPNGDGPWPVIMEQRYASFRGASTRQRAARTAERGYVVALVNFRGTQLSEGHYVGYRALQWGELRDGYDACEWLGKQKWSTGKVGTRGGSQGGYAQNYLAVTQPPSLVCQYMTDTGVSLFQEGYRIGGATRPVRFKGMARVCRDPADNDALLKEWFAHPNYDDYWRAEDCSLHFDKMNVPCFTLGSWFDFMNQGSIASFVGRQHKGGPKSRGNQWLLIGPWLHGGSKGAKIAEMQFPENAAFSMEEHMIRWFDFWLKGKANGIDKDPQVRYYHMGAEGGVESGGNNWKSAIDWPVNDRLEPLYLGAGGSLSEKQSTTRDSRTSYTSDPFHPMEIPGRSFPGARDARKFEEQAEVRTFTTEPLTEAVEWTGRVQAELFVSSTARDTDFIVRVSDVYPDGRSMLLIDYPWRMRYRNGFESEELMKPGKVYKLKFPVGWISQVFEKGHRIRVTISSTGAPLYEPNPQTGKPLTIEFPKDAVVAVNSVHHSDKHASRILAPVMK